MDERQLARLVDEVERAFPGDPAAQREAWEFLEAFMDAWDEADAVTVADAADDRSATFRRLLAAGRELLRDAAGRVVTVVDELVPPQPAVVLDDPPPPPSTVTLDADVAAELGLEPEIAVGVGTGRVMLRATTAETAAPERLAAILVSEASDRVFAVRFTRIDPSLAAARFDIGDAAPPLRLALVVVEPDRG